MEKENFKFNTGNEIADKVLSEMLEQEQVAYKIGAEWGYLRALKELKIAFVDLESNKININTEELERLNFESRDKVLYAISCIQEHLYKRYNNKDGE